MIELTRKHYVRLRFYWQGRCAGLTGQGDGIDLDLNAAGLIHAPERLNGGRTYFSVTAAGLAELHAEKERDIARRAPHHALGGRLAAYLREQGRITWTNIQLMVDRCDGSRQAVRPDVFSLNTTYDEKRLGPIVHEVKVSRQDFLSDVAQQEKREGYLCIAERMYYVAPEGMIAANEVPLDCGLMVETAPGVFRIEKEVKRKKVRLTTHHLMNLVLKHGQLKN